MLGFLKRLWAQQQGVTAVEYALIILFVIVGIVSFVAGIGSNVSKPFQNSGSAISGTVS